MVGKTVSFNLDEDDVGNGEVRVEPKPEVTTTMDLSQAKKDMVTFLVVAKESKLKVRIRKREARQEDKMTLFFLLLALSVSTFHNANTHNEKRKCLPVTADRIPFFYLYVPFPPFFSTKRKKGEVLKCAVWSCPDRPTLVIRPRSETKEISFFALLNLLPSFVMLSDPLMFSGNNK